MESNLSQTDLDQISDIVSLGDNCEFGFVQRHLKLEPSGLLRWAIAKPEGILKLLQIFLAGKSLEAFYAFEGIVPNSPKMVREAFTDFCFHTTMYSEKNDETKELEFIHPLSERIELWKSEKEKILYLLTKFQNTLSESGKIYVIKKLPNVDFSTFSSLSEALAEFHSDNKLLLAAVDKTRAGELEQPRKKISTGYLKKFAPYSAANDCDYESWITVLKRL